MPFPIAFPPLMSVPPPADNKSEEAKKMIGALSAAYITPTLANDPAAARKVSVPVRPLLLPSMAFEHVLAVPARPGEEAIPAYQIQALEDLIDELTGRSGHDASPPPAREKSIDTLPQRITRIGARLQAAARSLSPFSAGVLPSAGTLVNRLA
jgi:hypothetical protein